MKIKTVLLSTTILLINLHGVLSSNVLAAPPDWARNNPQAVKTSTNTSQLERTREQLQEKIKEKLEEKIGTQEGFLKGLFNRATILNGVVTDKSGNTLTVTKDGKSYTVLTDDKTKFRRHFWGKSSLNEIIVGHSVNVFGTWSDNAKTTIKARLVRDLSVQRRFGAFIGNVLSLTSSGWVMETNNRGNQTVTVSSTTKFVNRKQEPITKSDILVGHRLRVKGLWDRTNNTITEVAQVKDFSLPLKPSVTPPSKPSVTPKVTPTVTPTVIPIITPAP